MKKALLIASVLFIAVVSTACINNIAVQELNNKAAEFMQKGDYDSAINRLQASIDLDSTMYETYYNLGIAAINAKKYETAIDALEKGIQIKEEYENFYYSLAIAQNDFANEILDNNDEVENITITDNAKPIETKKQISQNELAQVASLKSNALKNLNKYIELSPNSKDKDEIESLISELETYLNQEETKVKK